MMTTLLIDAGNSRLKWALYSHEHLNEVGSLTYPQPFLVSSLAEQLTSSWSFFNTNEKAPDRIIISNVAGQKIHEALHQWLYDQVSRERPVKDGTHLTIDSVTAQNRAFGVQNAYLKPETLGADRWAALVAARHLVDGDCCVIDCGSALTMDVISKDGHHKGGTIGPGWEMMARSLVRNTDAIDDKIFDGSQPFSGLLGNTTKKAIDAGLSAAITGAVIHVIQTYLNEENRKLYCVLTGGCAEKLLAQLLTQFPEGNFRYEPDWVLKGLAIIADNTAGKVQNDDTGNMT